jgi:quercetin dioxygenase-like cupin family protein
MKTIVMAGLLLLAVSASADERIEYEKAGDGTREMGIPGRAQFRILVEEANLGSGEVEIAEVTFPVEAYSARDIPGHRHGSIEIFYILEGLMEHIVNGESYMLSPGMVGIVRPEDTVVHRVAGDVPVRALVIWAPGGEVDRLFQRAAD